MCTVAAVGGNMPPSSPCVSTRKRSQFRVGVRHRYHLRLHRSAVQYLDQTDLLRCCAIRFLNISVLQSKGNAPEVSGLVEGFSLLYPRPPFRRSFSSSLPLFTPSSDGGNPGGAEPPVNHAAGSARQAAVGRGDFHGVRAGGHPVALQDGIRAHRREVVAGVRCGGGCALCLR